MARVYFALDKFNLPTNVDKEMTKVVAYLKANSGAKALVTGFHDPSGDKVHNVNLALNRARAVEAELINEGIPKDRIVKEQPNETTGTGDAREARRVEVTIRP